MTDPRDTLAAGRMARETLDDYEQFLARKTAKPTTTGPAITADDVHPWLHPWQREMVAWAVRTQRAAIWATRDAVSKAFPGRGWTYSQAGAFRAATRDWAAERRGKGGPLLLRTGES